MRRHAAASALLLTLTLACRTIVNDRLYFGTAIPAGGSVSEADWKQFVETVVTPRFPSGFSILQENGQWRDERGKIWREPGYIIEVTHPLSGEDERAITEIANEYKKRFGQDAVLRVTSRATMRLY